MKGNQPIAWQPLPEGLNPIYAVALTPDGQYAAAGRANQIFIYHVPSGELVTRLTDDALLKDKLYAKRGVAHRDMTYSLAFSPDGTLLASGSYREIKLWRRPANVQKSTFALTSPKPVEILATSADGKWLASADGNTVKLLDATSGKEARTLTGHTNAVTSLQFSPTTPSSSPARMTNPRKSGTSPTARPSPTCRRLPKSPLSPGFPPANKSPPAARTISSASGNSPTPPRARPPPARN